MIFRQLRLKTALLFLVVSSTLFAQKDFQGKAYYETKSTVDMSSFGGRNMSEERKKEIARRMKSALEKNFILTFNQAESIYVEEEQLDAPGDSRSMRFAMMTSSGGDLYKNIKTQQLSQKQDLFGKQFLIKDSLQTINWELTGETKTIGKYMCFKAVAMTSKTSMDFRNFRSRPSSDEKPADSLKTNTEDQKKPVQDIMVTAWYTPQIPVNIGPDVYWGLPGLILEVSADNTTILCSKIIINPSEKEEIEAPTKGKEVTQAEFDEISKSKMEEMREMRGGRGRGGRR